ncbi:MAG: peptidyl-tRNA hydrolase Pth2 [Candidatus Nanosalina sp.]
MPPQKQAIILREDLDMSKGKMIAQAAHASLKAYRKADSGDVEEWENQGARKIVLAVESSEELDNRYSKADSKGLPVSEIRDAGRTELESGTKTAIGIGPAEESKIDSVTGDLKLIK